MGWVGTGRGRQWLAVLMWPAELETGFGVRRDIRPNLFVWGLRGREEWQAGWTVELGPWHQGMFLKRHFRNGLAEQAQPPKGPFVLLAIEALAEHCTDPALPLYIPPWWRPVPARGWEFCRLYRNWHPIFLQLSDFVNLDYSDRRKVF
jgi:hypothetical protein